MITNIRIDLDDKQRDKLSRVLNPSKQKSLASRKDVTAFVTGCIDAALSTNLVEHGVVTKTPTTRVAYFRSLERHLRKEGNHSGADIAAQTVSDLGG